MNDFKRFEPKMTTREGDGKLTMYVMGALVVLLLVVMFLPVAAQFANVMTGISDALTHAMQSAR